MSLILILNILSFLNTGMIKYIYIKEAFVKFSLRWYEKLTDDLLES